MSLVRCAYDDVVSMIMQNEELEGYLTGATKSMGRSASQPQVQKRNLQNQIREGHEYSDALRSGTYMEDVTRDEQASRFQPSSGASHKAPSHTLSRNPLQATFTSVDPERQRMEPILSQYQQSNPTHDEDPSFTAFWTQASKRQQGRDNPPIITFRAGLIRRCYGCKKHFSERTRTRPHNMLFKMLAYRDDIPDGRGGWRTGNTMQNVFFHMNMRCVRLIYPRVNLSEVETYDETWKSMIVGHHEVLRKIGLWEILLAKMGHVSAE